MKCKLIKGTGENLKEVTESLGLRSKMKLTKIVDVVSEVLEDIRENGDAAVYKYTEKFDGCDLREKGMKVSKEDIDAAIGQIDPELLAVIKKSAANIRKFHEQQKEEGFMMETG